ncbi:DUF262 domain-containing protein [Myroides odoratimimus]|uniref:DUF262 domain-containing protein n=1 Tax=Myroides odoratimimus TaxID=76832 RepID=UPI002576658D|nr:DUF262 domain-containing protein [Myroides odoratimimus]MDM1679850.1 DUF262 domain-containing protein [Myroides odoratimimus]
MEKEFKNQDSVSIDFFLTNNFLEISEYQRPYVWTGQQIINLYNDLIDFSSSQEDLPDYYLGSIILVKSKEPGEYKIVDGQQRIISLLIIDRLINKQFHQNSLNITSKATADNIRKNAGYLKSYIKQHSDKIQINWERVNITYIIAENDDQAFKFYTTLSTSGKRLTGIDIIKPFHLQAIPKACQEEKAILLEKYQFDQNKLENIVKILLRARYWKGVDFKEFPRNHVEAGWKIELESEFVKNTRDQLDDIKYFSGIQINGINNQFFPVYKVGQPLNKGINSINYILYFAGLWDKITDRINDLKLNAINFSDNTAFNQEYFQATLLSFVSKFGEDIIHNKKFEEDLKLLFKICFYTRLNKPVSKDTIYNFEKENKLINRILLAYSIEEIREYCISFYNPQIIKKFKEHLKEESKNPTTIQRFAKKLDVNCDNIINPFFN